MILRINDVSYKKGTFFNNFKRAESGNTYNVYLHLKKDVGDNYRQVTYGKIGIVKGSIADACIQKLALGCNRIDIIEVVPNRYLACFRESLVQVSTYFEIEGFTLSMFEEAVI